MPGPWTSRITISWTANSESDLAGYKIYAGRSTGVYGSAGTPITVASSATSGVVPIDATGAWYFAVTAFDTTGNESGFSTEVSRSWLLLGNM